APSPSKRVSAFSKSSYTRTLPPDARETIVPGESATTTEGLLREARGRNRGTYVILLTLVIAAFVVTAIVLASRTSSRTASITDGPAASRADAHCSGN